jgi:predicted transposase YbfD/YdcC
LAIDGKTLRGSYDRGDSKAAIHMVSVWATANHLTLGSVTVDEKSNEITAIPRLLELIDVSGALVTIDAMGCQKEIAQKIVDHGADYVLAVKDNQPKLHEAVMEFFEATLEKPLPDPKCRQQTRKEKGHGRKEERSYVVAPVPEDFPPYRGCSRSRGPRWEIGRGAALTEKIRPRVAARVGLQGSRVHRQRPFGNFSAIS